MWLHKVRWIFPWVATHISVWFCFCSCFIKFVQFLISFDLVHFYFNVNFRLMLFIIIAHFNVKIRSTYTIYAQNATSMPRRCLHKLLKIIFSPDWMYQSFVIFNKSKRMWFSSACRIDTKNAQHNSQYNRMKWQWY